MRKLSLILAIVLIIGGLYGCKADEKLFMKFSIESLGMVVGREAGKAGFVWNADIEAYYNEVIAGKVTVETFIKAQNYLSDELNMDPLIVNRMLALCEMLGAQVDAGEIVDVSGVNLEYVQWAFDGFRMGLAMASVR